MFPFDQRYQNVSNQYNAGENLYIIRQTTSSKSGRRTGISILCKKYKSEIMVVRFLVSTKPQVNPAIIYQSSVESSNTTMYKLDSNQSIFINMEPQENYELVIWVAKVEEPMKPLRNPIVTTFQLNEGQITEYHYEPPSFSFIKALIGSPIQDDAKFQQVQYEQKDLLSTNGFSISSLIQNIYKKVNEQIKQLHSEINSQDGFFLFKKHKYTIEELLESPHFNKINAITEKLGNDIQNWYINGKISNDEKKLYDNVRSRIEKDLNEVTVKIVLREHTWSEKISKVFQKFINIIMDNLPNIPVACLDGRKVQKRLPPGY